MSKEIEIHKNMITGETEIRDICVYVERDSVCMGDDVTAPHEKKLFFRKSDKLSDFFKELMQNYLLGVQNHDRVWQVSADNNVLGYVTHDSNLNKTYELAISDDLIVNLKMKTVYCKNIRR